MGACLCRPQRAAEAAVRAGTVGHAVAPVSEPEAPRRPSPPQPQPSEDEIMEALAGLPRPGDLARRRAEADALRRAEPGKTPNLPPVQPWVDPERPPGPLMRRAHAAGTAPTRPKPA